ncbi:hypothetical protein PMG71_05795 [Roseofilum sp. BLCC_M154]|jgi:Ni,Fe-hydrogenase III large subunit|uniref:Uncharacterized protein n=1 Tax=Roseofilum acuticapitatum BLCC-M154 TaxID=3022444 RepID=A0ABT7APV7_9CYAN|nr:hypothetical protein [Roseofilum acuticapitatum]MDJ1168933.1 hypothetical protein [Roseofilum acuticapitatum BLCC-M154]
MTDHCRERIQHYRELAIEALKKLELPEEVEVFREACRELDRLQTYMDLRSEDYPIQLKPYH